MSFRRNLVKLLQYACYIVPSEFNKKVTSGMISIFICVIAFICVILFIFVIISLLLNQSLTERLIRPIYFENINSILQITQIYFI
jgi:hypothetical protein